MKRTFISFLLFVLYCGLIYGRIIDADATVFFKEIFNFLEVEGMKPYVVNEQHMRFMYDDKQYNLVVYDGKPSLVRLYTDYSNILPLSDSTSIVIRKPDGVKVEFLDKTYRLTVDTHSLDAEPFKYEIYRQINMMGKAKVYFSYPDKGHKSQPELTYDKLKFTRKKINDSSEIFEVSCADGNKVSFNMVYVLGGSFEMGDLEGEHKSETVADFYICDSEVSRRLWEIVMGYVPMPYRGLKTDVDYPVNYVSWNDAQRFIRKLNSLTDMKFRLPSEVEWEYAAKGGRNTHNYKYSGSNKLQDVAVYISLSGKPAQLKSKSANELGLYDMSGNVAEWCDNGDESDTKPARGGSYASDVNLCKVYETVDRIVDYREASVGLRLVLSVE